MDTYEMRKRIRELERRMRRVEAHPAIGLATRPAGGPSPAPEPDPTPTPSAEIARPDPERGPVRVSPPAPPVPPTPPAPTRTPPPPREPRKPIEWERFFGMAVLGRVGVAAVLLAAGYFAQLAYRELTDVMRVFSIYGLAAAFIGVGAYLRPRASNKYVALLWGGGAAAAYLAGIVARTRYGLVSSEVGLLLLVAASMLGHVLARTLKHQTLASIALAGAFAAPMLVGAIGDARTFLLGYVALLMVWASLMERWWEWKAPRIVALCGLFVVGGFWLARHGGLDAWTYWHIGGYIVLGLLPMLAEAARGRLLGRNGEIALVGATAVMGLFMLLPTLQIGAGRALVTGMAMPAFGLVYGGLMLAMATAFACAGRFARNRTAFQGLAHIGGLFVVGTLGLIAAASPGWFGQATMSGNVATAVILLAAIGLVLRAHQRWVQAGELAACFAIGIAAVLSLLVTEPWHGIAAAGAAAALAGVLLWFHRSTLAGAVAVWGGLVAIWFGVAATQAWGPRWPALAFTAGALWLIFAQFVGERRRRVALLDHAYVGALLLALVWIPSTMAGGFLDALVPLGGPYTLAGVLVAAALLIPAARGPRWIEHAAQARRALWGVSGVVFLLIVGHREVGSAVSALAGPARDALHILYLSAAAVVVALIGLRRRARGLQGLAVVVLAFAHLAVVGNATAAGDSWWSVLSLLAPAVATAGLVARLSPRRTQALLWLRLGGMLSAFAWAIYVLEDRLHVGMDVLNARALSGMLIVLTGWAAGAVLRRRLGRTGTVASLVWWLLPLAYSVGLVELLDVVGPLEGAWPRVMVSVYTTLFAAAMLATGFVRTDRKLRYAALATFGAVILKVGLYDLGNSPLPLRILVAGVLGLVLLGAAFAYARQPGARREGEGPRDANQRSMTMPV